jgi:hypothetical protein
MNTFISLVTAVALCVALAETTQAEEETDVLAALGDATVKIILTKLEVNDQSLELGWKIRNNTDHDVWICDSLTRSVPSFSECFLDRDAKTLLVRRRFDLPKEKGVHWEWPPYRARYVRLRPGQEKVESYSRALPVRPTTVFEGLRANAEYAQRLAVEVGFYDEDLPQLMRDIVAVAEIFACDTRPDGPAPGPEYTDVRHRFFPGMEIARMFYNESFEDFRDSVMSGGDEVIIPFFPLATQAPYGEQVLRVIVDGVSIPYKSNYPPLTPKQE